MKLVEIAYVTRGPQIENFLKKRGYTLVGNCRQRQRDIEREGDNVGYVQYDTHPSFRKMSLRPELLQAVRSGPMPPLTPITTTVILGNSGERLSSSLDFARTPKIQEIYEFSDTSECEAVRRSLIEGGLHIEREWITWYKPSSFSDEGYYPTGIISEKNIVVYPGFSGGTRVSSVLKSFLDSAA